MPRKSCGNQCPWNLVSTAFIFAVRDGYHSQKEKGVTLASSVLLIPPLCACLRRAGILVELSLQPVISKTIYWSSLYTQNQCCLGAYKTRREFPKLEKERYLSAPSPLLLCFFIIKYVVGAFGHFSPVLCLDSRGGKQR